jgi:hypothetical protein
METNRLIAVVTGLWKWKYFAGVGAPGLMVRS